MVAILALSGREIPEAFNAVVRMWASAERKCNDVHQAYSTKAQVRKVEVDHEITMTTVAKLKAIMSDQQWTSLVEAANS